jgi:AraC-like DNA-binding protein
LAKNETICYTQSRFISGSAAEGGAKAAREARKLDDFADFRFSTEAFPERERIAAFCELYGRKMLRLEMEPQPDVPFHADVILRMLPGLGIVSARASLVRVGRTRQLLADADDNLLLQLSSSAGVASQFGREVAVGPGEAVLLSAADVGHFTYASAQAILAVSLPRASLALLLQDSDAALVHPVPRESEALRLLVRYLGIFQDMPALASPELQRLAIAHVCDLLSVALGATRDAAEIAEGRGVRAARLCAIKAAVLANLGRGDLSVTHVAKQHGVTPRYVQMLFEAEGTTFSGFVREQRLERARRMLTDPRCADRTISAIAYAVGFGDLSHFNHAFRRRYGASPSDVRAAARRADPA